MRRPTCATIAIIVAFAIMACRRSESRHLLEPAASSRTTATSPLTVRIRRNAPGAIATIPCGHQIEYLPQNGEGPQRVVSNWIFTTDPSVKVGEGWPEIPVNEKGELLLSFDAPGGTRVDIQGVSTVLAGGQGRAEPAVIDLRREFGAIELSALSEQRARDGDDTRFTVPMRITSPAGHSMQADLQVTTWCVRAWIGMMFVKATHQPVILHGGDEPGRARAAIEVTEGSTLSQGKPRLEEFFGIGRVSDISLLVTRRSKDRKVGECGPYQQRGWLTHLVEEATYFAYNRRAGREIARLRIPVKASSCPGWLTYHEGDASTVTDSPDPEKENSLLKPWVARLLAR